MSEICEKWSNNPTISPYTYRPISPLVKNGEYQKIANYCGSLGIYPKVSAYLPPGSPRQVTPVTQLYPATPIHLKLPSPVPPPSPTLAIFP